MLNIPDPTKSRLRALCLGPKRPTPPMPRYTTPAALMFLGSSGVVDWYSRLRITSADTAAHQAQWFDVSQFLCGQRRASALAHVSPNVLCRHRAPAQVTASPAPRKTLPSTPHRGTLAP